MIRTEFRTCFSRRFKKSFQNLNWRWIRSRSGFSRFTSGSELYSFGILCTYYNGSTTLFPHSRAWSRWNTVDTRIVLDTVLDTEGSTGCNLRIDSIQNRAELIWMKCYGSFKLFRENQEISLNTLKRCARDQQLTSSCCFCLISSSKSFSNSSLSFVSVFSCFSNSSYCFWDYLIGNTRAKNQHCDESLSK